MRITKQYFPWMIMTCISCTSVGLKQTNKHTHTNMRENACTFWIVRRYWSYHCLPCGGSSERLWSTNLALAGCHSVNANCIDFPDFIFALYALQLLSVLTVIFQSDSYCEFQVHFGLFTTTDFLSLCSMWPNTFCASDELSNGPGCEWYLGSKPWYPPFALFH